MMTLSRLHWRMQRATHASAVVVVRSRDGRVLLLRHPSGMLQLPRKELDGWITIAHQVEDWLNDLLTQSAAISLVSVEGSCGDFTFVYTAKIDNPPVMPSAARWLAPDLSAVSLKNEEAALLRSCIDKPV
jgi:hypothetical protein